MYASPNPFAEFHQAGMHALIEFAHGQLTAFGRLFALNSKLVRSAFDDSAIFAKAMLVAQDPPELSRLGAALALPALDRTIVYSLGVCELGAQAQGEMARLVDAQAAEFNKGIVTGLDRIAHYVPAGSGMMVNSAKSAFDTVSAAFDSLTEFGIKTSELAQTKFAAVSSGIADADSISSQSGKANRKIGKDGKNTKKKAG